MNSALVVGLDGATWKVINPLIKKGKLPFLSKIKRESFFGVSVGTIPPLTPSVWTSFLTGVNPGKHGIYGFLNYRKNKPKPSLFKSSDIEFPSLDEVVKSYISFKDLDGLIEIAGTENLKVKAEDLVKSAGEKIESFKMKDKQSFTSYKQSFTSYKQSFTSNKKHNFKFIFILFKEVDAAQHLYWGKSELEEFFLKLDKVLSDLYDYYQKNYSGEKNLLILSDHGFHKAGDVQFSVYPWLRIEKYIKMDISIKNKLWNTLHRVNSVFKSFGFNLSDIKSIQIRRNTIVRGIEEKSQAKILNKSGIRATFEGLYIYNEELSRKEIIEKLKKLKFKSKKIFQFVELGEKVYKGALFDAGPDIVWMPNEKFHINISPLESKIFSDRPTKIPGDHVGDRNGIFILKTDSSISDSKKIPKSLSILDMRPLIHDLLDIKKPLGLDGVSPIADYTLLDKKIKKAKEVILMALKSYSPLAAAFTGRKDSTVMMHMVREVCWEKRLNVPPVFFIDHGFHFRESLTFLKKTLKKWRLKTYWEKITPKNENTLANTKIAAIRNSIQKYKWKALITAIRRDENSARENERYFSKRENHTRIHPMLDFTEADIWDYIKRFNIPYNPLYDKGYRSIEEKDTTMKVKNYRKSERSGRDKNKEEIMDSLRKLGYF